MASRPYKGRWPTGHDAIARAAGHESWDAWILAVEARLGWEICGGKWPRRDGPPCGRQAGWGIPGVTTGRCRDHNRGAARAGPTHPNYRHGRNSKFAGLAARYRERYERYVEHHDYLEFRAEIAALDARIDALLSHGHEPASPEALRGRMEDCRRALDGDDVERIQSAFAALEAALDATVVDSAAWSEVERLWALRSRLVDTELRRIQRESSPMSEAQFAHEVEALVRVVIGEGYVAEERVPDLLRRLEAEVSRSPAPARRLVSADPAA